MSVCGMCAAGLHSSCIGSCKCLEANHNYSYSQTETEVDETQESDDSSRHTSSRSTGRSVRSGKRDAVLKDQQSTGRKRAARMYPLNLEAPCEWQGLANCGGGPHPIVGCRTGLQQARHHGPDKSVSNNDEGNVHRICHSCHYRWHAANDNDYDWNKTEVYSHAPWPQREAEVEESIMSQLKYLANKQKKIKD